MVAEEGDVETAELYAHTERGLEALRLEFADSVPADEVTRLGRDRLDALLATASINDYVPLLVYRLTREALLTIEPAYLHRAV